MVSNKEKGSWLLELLGIFIAVFILGFCEPPKNRTTKQEEYVIKDYQIKQLEKEVKVLEIEALKKARLADSLKKIINTKPDEKIRIKKIYIAKRDSVAVLPVDSSIDFFTRNLPTESNR